MTHTRRMLNVLQIKKQTNIVSPVMNAIDVRNELEADSTYTNAHTTYTQSG